MITGSQRNSKLPGPPEQLVMHQVMHPGGCKSSEGSSRLVVPGLHRLHGVLQEAEAHIQSGGKTSLELQECLGNCNVSPEIDCYCKRFYILEII